MNISIDYAHALRDAVKIFIRNMGMLEGKKAFCCDCTYSQCHTIIEVGISGTISLVELAQRLRVNKSAMSRVVDDLVKIGYLRREPDPRDRRYVVIELTEVGSGVCQQIEENSLRQFSKIVAALPEQTRQTVVDGLMELNKAMASSLLSTECCSKTKNDQS